MSERDARGPEEHERAPVISALPRPPGGKRGNPVLWDRRFFAEMAKVSGDTGAKHLIGEHADLVCEVEMAGEAAITDIDTPEALAAWRERSTA